jgi:citrate lyase beta subunit
LAVKAAKREGLQPIDVVTADAADLVTIDNTLRQIVNVKGN